MPIVIAFNRQFRDVLVDNLDTLEFRTSNNTVLAEFSGGFTTFSVSNPGIGQSLAGFRIPGGTTTSAQNAGDIDHARLVNSGDGSLSVDNISVGLSGADIIINDLSLVAGQVLSITTFEWVASTTLANEG